MKKIKIKILIITFLLFANNIVFSGPFLSDGNNVLVLEDNSIHYIIGTIVNIRKEPDTKSSVVGQAVIGDKVKILENTEKRQEIYEINSCWYKIECNNKIGFIWGGLISTMELKADFDLDGREELLLILCTSGNDFEFIGRYMAAYRVTETYLCRKGELIAENLFDDTIIVSPELNVIAKKDFNPEVTFLNIERCMGDGPVSSCEKQLYYFRNNKFNFLFNYNQASYMDIDEKRYNLIFPNDKSGKNNIIFLQQYEREYDSENEKYLDEELIFEIELIWDGNFFNE